MKISYAFYMMNLVHIYGITKEKFIKSIIGQRQKGTSGFDPVCPPNSPCVTLLIYSQVNETKTTEYYSGCALNITNGHECFSRCILLKESDPAKKYLLCCCRGRCCNQKRLNEYLRNGNLSVGTTPPGNHVQNDLNKNSTIIMATVISAVTFLLVVICLFVIYFWRKIEKRNRTLHQMHLQQEVNVVSMTKTLSDDILESLLTGNLIHQGSHSAVRLGSIHGKPVAVKVFSSSTKNKWQNEKDIYISQGNHPNIAKFIVSEQISQGYGFQGIIVLSHYTEGTLLNFLRNNTLSWERLIKLACCITKGLAYLHGEEKKDRSPKVPVAHRNLSSRNVLMRSDGTCVIADFGVALKLNDKQEIPLGCSPRYMAPELLDGSAVKCDTAAAFKQIDCYSLALLLWELSRRCHDIVDPDCTVPECLLPYEEELGFCPSASKVRAYVCEQQMRPQFPQAWIKDSFTLSFLTQTIIKCWDQDGYARLTPLCVLNRFREMEDFSATERNIYKEISSQDIDIFCSHLESECDLLNLHTEMQTDTCPQLTD